MARRFTAKQHEHVAALGRQTIGFIVALIADRSDKKSSEVLGRFAGVAEQRAGDDPAFPYDEIAVMLCCLERASREAGD